MRTSKSALAILVGMALIGGCGQVPPAASSASVPSPWPASSSPITPTPSPVPAETPTEARVGIQLANDLPLGQVEVAAPGSLTDNGIGDVFDAWSIPRARNACPPAEDDWTVTHVRDLGFTWARVSVDVLEWETAQAHELYSQPEVSPCADAMVTALADGGVEMVHTIVHWDAELHADRPPDYGNPDEVRRYIDYARMLVRHFEGRIGYYEILNEATVYVSLQDYLALVRQVIPVIRDEDPDAKVVVGGASYLIHEGELEFIRGVLSSDVMPSVDAVNLHPMYGTAPEHADTRDYYWGYPGLIAELQALATHHGFEGVFLAEELTWPTVPTGAVAQHDFRASTAAKYYARSIVTNRGLGVWAAIGGASYERMPELVRALQGLTTLLDLAEPTALRVTVETEALPTATYRFVLPNGDRLIALWTDGPAADFDPGAPATVRVEGSVQRAEGIDVFSGQRRELILRGEDGRFAIEDLILHDYPVFVRLEGWSSSSASREMRGFGLGEGVPAIGVREEPDEPILVRDRPRAQDDESVGAAERCELRPPARREPVELAVPDAVVAQRHRGCPVMPLSVDISLLI